MSEMNGFEKTDVLNNYHVRTGQCEDVSFIQLDGVDIHRITMEQTKTCLLQAMEAGQGGVVVTVNVDHMVRCRRDRSYLKLVQGADLVVADGMPLVWASKLQGTPLPERVAGSSLSLSLVKDLAESGRRLFLLGGDPGVAENAAGCLVEKHPDLIVAGVFCPDFGFENNPESMSQIAHALAAAKPDVVYVALGSPKQERLIQRLRSDLPEVEGVWWLGVGISLSFITGDVARAPVWMQKLGLEWAHRLVQEPRRLFRRYVVDGIPYAAKLIFLSVLKRLGSC